MKSDMQNAEAVIDGPYRHYAIERRIQLPDPNTAKAVVKGAVVIGGGL